MSSGSQAHSITNILSGFTSAESVAEDVIESILAEGGKQLYEAYIHKKSFSSCAESTSNLLAAELKMCYVRHDEGEPTAPLVSAVAASQVDRCEIAPQFAATPSIVVPVPQADRAVVRLTIDTDDLDGDPAQTVSSATGVESAAGGAPSSSAEPSASSTKQVSCYNWELEAEPTRCRIDTWARACVPVRRAVARPRTGQNADQSKKTNAKGLQTPRPTPRAKQPTSPSAGKFSMVSPTASDGGLSRQVTTEIDSNEKMKTKDGMIPLVVTVEKCDEEESAMREMKEREAKRKREDESRVNKKVTEEAEEAVRQAQVKDQMKNKPFTYDSNGQIIWVQALQADRLPNANTIPGFVLRREVISDPIAGHDRRASQLKGNPATAAKNKNLNLKAKSKDIEFVDTFKKFSSQQPLMMDTMRMAPGVHLKERGTSKSGEDVSGKRRSKDTAMTRRDYENLVQSGGGSGYPAKEKEEVKDTEGAASNTQANGQEDEDRGAEGKLPDINRPASKKTTAVSPVTPASDLVPHAPTMARPEQPVPPPSVRRVQLKRDALGFVMSTRERVPTGTGSRFPGCAAAPLLGATMGHGLLPQGSKYEEYYFPKDDGVAMSLVLDDQDGIGQASPPASPRVPQGTIVSKNPELVRRFFNH